MEGRRSPSRQRQPIKSTGAPILALRNTQSLGIGAVDRYDLTRSLMTVHHKDAVLRGCAARRAALRVWKDLQTDRWNLSAAGVTWLRHRGSCS